MLDHAKTRPLESPLLTRRLAGTPVRHGFFTRQGGESDGLYASLNVGLGSADRAERVARNRARIAAHFGLGPERLATVNQVHSADVVTIDAGHDGRRPRADALVTATPGLVLGVLAADCGPILFAAPASGIVGAAHAGWRGALAGIVERTVAAMEALGAAREDIVACLGPSISAESYEVGPEFVDRFLAEDAAFSRHFRPAQRPGHAMFDLRALTLERLAAAGVTAEAIDACTYADAERFFSYRRSTHRGEPDYGRQISAICITE